MRNHISQKITSLNQTILFSYKETSLEKIAENFTKTGLDILAGDFGFVWLKDIRQKGYELVYYSPSTPYEPMPPRKGGKNETVDHSASSLFVENLKINSKLIGSRYDVSPYLKSYVIIPISYQDKKYGNIVLCFKNKKKFTSEEKSLCNAVGNAMAQAITINQLYGNLKDFKDILDNTLDGVFIFEPSKLKIQYSNHGAVSLLGKKRSDILRKNLVELIGGLSSHDLHVKMKEIMGSSDLRALVFESWVQHPKNGKIPVEIKLEQVVQKGQPERFLAIVRDIGERKQSQDTIRRMAYYDALTGLPNRVLLAERVNEEFARAQAHRGKFALMFLDLDKFKIINDIYGHHVGDQLLRQVSQRLQKALPHKTTISRMGGDEFLILIPKIENIKEVIGFAQNIYDKFIDFFQIEDQEIYVNCSIGISIYPQDGTDTRTIMKRADAALHRAKEQGGSNYQQYTAGLPMLPTMYAKLEKQLRQAIKKNELLVHYQPIVSMDTQKIVGCEALVRWNHPEMGILYPRSFINHAEESGLIVQIGEWIFNEVCRQIQDWQKKDLNVVPVSINVSPRELLRPTFVKRIEEILKKYETNSDDIKIELTETFLMKNIDLSVGILEQLKLLGISILIDDFGTGYASLNYLKRLPIDAVKIDRTFIQGSGVNLQDAALTSAIISIGHQLGMEVIAEGVESESQKEFLKEHNCNSAQGNLFFKPMPAEEMAKLIKPRGK